MKTSTLLIAGMVAFAGALSARGGGGGEPAPAEYLMIVNQPGGGDGGEVWTQINQPLIEARGADGDTDPNFHGMIIAELSNGEGTLLGTTQLQAEGGVAMFTDLAINEAGSGYRLIFSAPDLPDGYVESEPFNVNIGPPAVLEIVQQPVGGYAGSLLAVQPLLALRDLGGNLCVDSQIAVIPYLVGDQRFGLTGADVNGVQARDGYVEYETLRINVAGSGYILEFSDGGDLVVTSESFDVSGTPDRLHVHSHPAKASYGVPFARQPVIHIHDPHNNMVGADNATVVTASIYIGAGELLGTTSVTAVNGVAEFHDLAIDTWGVGYRLLFTAGDLFGAVSGTFPVAGDPFQLAVIAQPQGGEAGEALAQQPVVEIRDQNGVRVINDNATEVTVHLLGGSSGALGGDTVAVVEQGRAVFTNLAVNAEGDGYLLVFSAAGLAPAQSETFQVGDADAQVDARSSAAGACSAATGASPWLLLILLAAVLAPVARSRRA